jgi:hypothetical protein
MAHGSHGLHPETIEASSAEDKEWETDEETPHCLRDLPEDDAAREAECMERYKRPFSPTEKALLECEAMAAHMRMHPGQIPAKMAIEYISNYIPEPSPFAVEDLKKVCDRHGLAKVVNALLYIYPRDMVEEEVAECLRPSNDAMNKLIFDALKPERFKP